MTILRKRALEVINIDRGAERKYWERPVDVIEIWNEGYVRYIVAPLKSSGKLLLLNAADFNHQYELIK